MGSAPHVRWLALALLWPSLAAAGMVEDWVARFAQSEIRFQRSTSRVPFPPVAFAEASLYGDADVKLQTPAGEQSFTFDQRSVAQAAALPLLAGPRDALIIGEWIDRTDFSTSVPGADSFDVLTVGIPFGWFRQATEDWQVAAFAMPIGHRTSFRDADWTFEYMGGAFARRVHNDHLWWAFGFFADVSPGKHLYLPYLGASWAVNEAWTLSAVMPWPAVLYAPNADTLIRLGVSPSGASWSLNPALGEASFDLGGWDFGLGVERRVAGNAWLKLEGGVGGMRGPGLDRSGIESPDFDYGSTWYLALGLNIRPSLRR